MAVALEETRLRNTLLIILADIPEQRPECSALPNFSRSDWSSGSVLPQASTNQASTWLDDDAAHVIFVTHAGCHKAHLRYTCRRSSEMSRAVLQESPRRCSEMAARSRRGPHCVTDCSREKDNNRHRPPSASR